MIEQQTPLEKFIALIEFDRNQEAVNQRILALEHEIRALEDKEKDLHAVAAAAGSAVQTLLKNIATYERSVDEYNRQIADKKLKLDTATNPREYRAIITEIEHIGTEQLALEEQLLAAWSTLEQRKRFHDECLQSSTDQIKALHTLIAEKQNAIAIEKKTLVDQKEQRKSYEHGVPEEWLLKYAAMQSRVVDPIVPVQQDSCSSCFYSLTDPELMRLKRKALLQCKGCYRFLYIPSVHQQS